MPKISLLIAFFLASPSGRALTSQSFGSVQLNGGRLFSSPQENVTQDTLGLETKFRSETEWLKNFQFNFEFWAKYDSLNKSDSDVWQLELDDFSLSQVSGGRRIKIGQAFRIWEGTDLINPMDIMFSKNWVDPLNGHTRAAPGLFYDDNFGDFSMDFTYLIRQRPPLLPGSASPWWPRGFYLPTESQSLELRLGDRLDYEIEDPEILNHALDHNVALRLQYHGSNVEISLAGAEGLATPPLLVPVIDVAPIQVSPREIYELQSPVRIQPVLYRQRAVAAALVWTMGDVIFRLSANHIQPLGDDPRIPGWSELGVVGVEKTFYFGQQMLTLLGQFIDSRRPDSAGVSLLTSLYQQSAMLGARWAPSEKWTFLLAHFQETHAWSSFSRVGATWAFKDAWSLDVEGNIFEGPAASAIGTYDKNDSAYAHLKYSF